MENILLIAPPGTNKVAHIARHIEAKNCGKKSFNVVLLGLFAFDEERHLGALRRRLDKCINFLGAEYLTYGTTGEETFAKIRACLERKTRLWVVFDEAHQLVRLAIEQPSLIYQLRQCVYSRPGKVRVAALSATPVPGESLTQQSYAACTAALVYIALLVPPWIAQDFELQLQAHFANKRLLVHCDHVVSVWTESALMLENRVVKRVGQDMARENAQVAVQQRQKLDTLMQCSEMIDARDAEKDLLQTLSIWDSLEEFTSVRKSRRKLNSHLDRLAQQTGLFVVAAFTSGAARHVSKRHVAVTHAELETQLMSGAYLVLARADTLEGFRFKTLPAATDCAKETQIVIVLGRDESLPRPTWTQICGRGASRVHVWYIN